VDTWSERAAERLRIPKLIFHPECTKPDSHIDNRNHYWTYHYMPRNIKIAEEGDYLYDYEPYGRDWSGGTWTMLYAKKLGRPIEQKIIGGPPPQPIPIDQPILHPIVKIEKKPKSDTKPVEPTQKDKSIKLADII